MTQPLFDASGRRIPSADMRVHNQVSRNYFRILQPPVDYDAVWQRTLLNLQGGEPSFTAKQFAQICESILDSIRSDAAMSNLANGIHIPFLCPPMAGGGRMNDLHGLLEAVGRSFTGRFPDADFIDLCPGKPDDQAFVAPGSRYETFEAARKRGFVTGVYFPNCLAEFDVASQRRQMATLPENVGSAKIALSGPADAAAALIGSPELLRNEDQYAHHLCLSAIQEPDDQVVYTFEAYGLNLRFRYRSNMLTPTITQVSEQWAGGLTLFIA